MPYQRQIAEAVFDSAWHRKGLSFSVMIARQGGKNEISARVESSILLAFAETGGTAIKAAPTFHPQALISVSRLNDILQRQRLHPYVIFERGSLFRIGRARQLFLSAHPSSNVVGNTASLLLEIDESQDVSPDKFNRDFVPMGASSNVTTVHYGTAWHDNSLLEQVKQSNLELQRKDGIQRHFEFDWQAVAQHNPHYQRHFEFDWQAVAQHNPHYQRYVEAEQQRLGSDHPLFLSQYCLIPVSDDGRFLDSTRQALLQGRHSRLRTPKSGCVYVAGIDLAGESYKPAHDRLLATEPFRDSTVVTIGELRFNDDGLGSKLPSISVVEHYWWTGRPHTETFSRLIHILKDIWGCRRVIVDATGVGAGVAAFLRKSLGTSIVKPFNFTARSKSDLGFDLLAAINSGRLHTYKPDGFPESTEFWSQISKARSTVRPNQTINFFVDPSEGHDDFLSSLALLVHASHYIPRRASGRLRKGYE